MYLIYFANSLNSEYHCFMEKNKNNGTVGVQDANGKEVQKPLTIAEVQSMLRRDVNSVLLLMQAIAQDPAVQQALATFLHGRYMNERHKKELEAQEDLKI